MGLGVSLYPKNIPKNYEKLPENSLSRSFCHLLLGGYPYDELVQIEKILNIDLSIFRRYPETLDKHEEEELLYQLSLAKEEENDERITFINEEMARINKEWQEKYDISNDGWTEIELLEATIYLLLQKISNYPDYHLQIRSTTNWADYFQPLKNRKPRIKENDNVLESPTFIDDLYRVLHWIKVAKSLGVKWVTFYYI